MQHVPAWAQPVIIAGGTTHNGSMPSIVAHFDAVVAVIEGNLRGKAKKKKKKKKKKKNRVRRLAIVRDRNARVRKETYTP